VRVPAVEQQVGVVARAVGGAQLQEGTQLGLRRVQRDARRGVVTAERLHHVVGEEALHGAQDARGAQVGRLRPLR